MMGPVECSSVGAEASGRTRSACWVCAGAVAAGKLLGAVWHSGLLQVAQGTGEAFRISLWEVFFS